MKQLIALVAVIATLVACEIQGPTAPSTIGQVGISSTTSESSDPRLVTVDFKEDSGTLNLRFAVDWDVRRVDIVCERFHYTNAWGFSFKDAKPPAPANHFSEDDYTTRVQEKGIYRCTLTREDDTPDVVTIRFSNASDHVGNPPAAPGGPGSAYVLGSNIRPFVGLAGSAFTCTTSTITGDVGVSPGSSITGIPGLCVHNGAIISTALSVPAQADLTAHYAAFDALPCTPIAANLNGVILAPGVYCSGALASNLTGTLTLNGAGFYLIRFPSTLITSPGSNVSLQGGATCGGVHFQVASSATLEGNLTGNVIAFSSITLNPGAVLTGRALARNAAVTMTTATLTNAGCN